MDQSDKYDVMNKMLDIIKIDIIRSPSISSEKERRIVNNIIIEKIEGISGQFAIGENIVQVQSLEPTDLKELRKSLLEFQNGIDKLGLSTDFQNIINGDITAAILEAKKDEPNYSRITKRFEGAIETVKDVGDTIEKVSKWEWTGKIVTILGKLGLAMAL